MEILCLSYVICLFSIIFGLFGGLMYRNSQKSSREVSSELIYEESCATRVGLLRTTVPMGKVRIYKDFLVVKSVESIEIDKSEIIKVEKINNPISPRLKIHHSQSDKRVEIWTLNNSKLKETIEKNFNLI